MKYPEIGGFVMENEQTEAERIVELEAYVIELENETYRLRTYLRGMADDLETMGSLRVSSALIAETAREGIYP